jgi:type I restriction enzyme M protein
MKNRSVDYNYRELFISAGNALNERFTDQIHINNLFAMLLLKSISETKNLKTKITIPEGSSFSNIFAKRNEINIGNLINYTFTTIENSNPEIFKGIFNNVDFNRNLNHERRSEKNKRIVKFLEILNKIDLDSAYFQENSIGDFSNDILKYFVTKREFKKLFTPDFIYELIGKLAEPEPENLICDPFCGIGDLLIKTSNQIQNDCFLYGLESNENISQLCRINIFLNNLNAKIVNGEIITPDLIENNYLEKFHIIVSHLPLAVRRNNKGYLDQWFPINQMLDNVIEKEGRVITLVNSSYLKLNLEKRRILKSIIEENLLDSVIGLPSRLISPWNRTPVLLIFDKSREKGGINENRKDIMFIDARNEFQGSKNDRKLSGSNIDKIVKAYKKRENIKNFAGIVDVKEIENNRFDLFIPMYVKQFDETVKININEVKKDMDELETQLKDVKGKISKILNGIILDISNS